MNSRIQVPQPRNEPALEYRPGSPERRALKTRIAELKSQMADIPLYVGGREVRTGKLNDCRSPHNINQLLGRYHEGSAAHTQQAIDAALKARHDWARMPFCARAAIFLRAADLLAGDFRWTLNAATMLCQSKSVHQAEIDAACEMIDFLRFNVAFADRIYSNQPISGPGVWNSMEYRPLEGFVFAVTPFNFTSILGNLPAAPALMGNTVVWKAAGVTAYTAYHMMRLFQAAGLPDGVINMVTGPGAEVGRAALSSPDLAGVHFTGSTGVFQWMWKTVGEQIKHYRAYPRLVGETGGKDFIFVHASADPQAVATAMVRGAFEFQGQKCSAASRAYIPDSLWPRIKKAVGEMLSTVTMGSPEDFSNFFNAVIDKPAYENIKGYIDRAKGHSSCKILWGGNCDGSTGYFIGPTVIETGDPKYESMVEEIFGPVLTLYVYPEKKYSETLELCDRSSPYALTGAIFAADRAAVLEAQEVLVNAAGNFYINDKPTGAVVGQQPFGGARASGTNDKAGSCLNLLRWVSPRTIKETFDPPKDYRYPFLEPDKEQAPLQASSKPRTAVKA
ncbi:MAG: 1-pyrroline-5-carboxylate dehydrogenase [Elusimicrobia bacterium RIFCSPHIGHO2_02_FULL_57_9]|nr:MAG: 1-pyrroline-5-carboxylate dehydrogenase [Elusimicrobia bacterium RIFCSPHIGHO2_02_FULL_57_9]